MNIQPKRSKRKQTIDPRFSKSWGQFTCEAQNLKSQLADALKGSESFRDQYLLDSLLSKLPVDSCTAEDRARAAITTTRSDEYHNEKTNRRLRSYLYRASHESQPGFIGPRQKQRSPNHKFRWGFTFQQVLHEASYLIDSVLGDLSYGIFERSRFTSGASVGFPKAKGDPSFKYRDRVTCTVDCADLVLALIKSTPVWVKSLTERFGPDPINWIRIVKGNKGFTVQKNATTDRFCCKEPTGNILLQKGIGDHIRDNLLKVGVNLNSVERNRFWAWAGSIDGSHCTLDLKSASNSLTYTLTQLLLRPEWFDLIARCRSAFGQYTESDQPHRWEMLSSMGNGFTFELESLIFWALSEAVRRLMAIQGTVTVFGDDIIAPTGTVHGVIAVLNYAGFRINHDKSFWTGDFRESCGGHYKNGLDVTPIYIRKPVNTTSRMIWFLNAVRRWGDCGGIVDERLWPTYRRYQRKLIPPFLWGGNRLSSMSSLATPHQPRLRHRLKITDTPLDSGYPCLLRAMQFKKVDSSENENLLAGSDRAWFVGTSDPQVMYEILGKIDVTRSLSTLTSVGEFPVDLEINTEPAIEPIPHFCAELDEVA